MKSLDQKTAAPQHQQDVQAEAKSGLLVFVVFLFQKQVKEYFYTDNTQQENLKHLQCLFHFSTSIYFLPKWQVCHCISCYQNYQDL